MIRTKHLFIFIVACALVVLAFGIWSLCTDRGIPSGIQNEILFGETKNEYSLIPKDDSARAREREAFIAKIKSTLDTQGFEETVVETQAEEDTYAEPPVENSPVIFMQAASSPAEEEPTIIPASSATTSESEETAMTQSTAEGQLLSQ